MGQVFQGKTVVVTGTFVTMKRAEAEGLLSKAGALLSGSVSKKTDLLICGKDAGSKLGKAQSLGVKVMTEEEMVSALAGALEGGEVLAKAGEVLEKAKKEEEARMKGVREVIAQANQSCLERCGSTPGAMLLKYFQVFAQRPDVFVYDVKIEAPASNEVLLRKKDQVPPEFLALAADLGRTEWNWVFAKKKAERHEYSKGYNGGRLSFRGIENFRWHPKPEWWNESTDAGQVGLFDDPVAEGVTHLATREGEAVTDARLLFDNANDCEQNSLGGIYEYLKDGAKAGFAWYWQDPYQPGRGDFTQALYEASLPKDTPKETIVELLIAKGLAEADAKGLIAWLGEDVVILLHGSETPEGKARLALVSRFPKADQSSVRTMDLQSVESLATSGEALKAKEWKEILAEHAAFLESGGGGGSWQTLSVSGLPLCVYRGAAGSEGKQAVFRLKNLSGVKGKGARLSFSDLSGSYAKDSDFQKSDLSGSVMIDSVFEGAKFDGAVMKGVDLSGSRLVKASFRKADLTGADLEATDCTGADFTGAILEGAAFPGAKLDGVIDLPTAKKKS